MQTESPYDTSERWQPRPTLDGCDYTEAEVYAEERERIWWGDWICVGRAEEVPEPGDYLTRDVAGESILVTRNEQGELRAYYNVCRHRGTRFIDDMHGHVRKAFRCPYHAWTYDLDGRLLGTPNIRQDDLFDRSEHGLHAVAVDSYAGFLFIDLAPAPRPLIDALTDTAESITAFDRFRMDELRVGVSITYEVEANWKIVVENYNECLHCPTVHPELVKMVPLFRRGEVWTEDAGYDMVEGATSFTMTGRSDLPRLPGLPDEDSGRLYAMYGFPNLMLNMHPDCVMYYVLYPGGPGHTTVLSQYLFRPETIADPRFAPKPVVEFWDLISSQDWKICSRVQAGVGSRAYTGGIYPRQDRLLHWFNEDWRRAMGRPLVG